MVIACSIAILATISGGIDVQSRRERLDEAILIAETLPDDKKGSAYFEIGLAEYALGRKKEGESKLRTALKYDLGGGHRMGEFAVGAKKVGLDDVYEDLLAMLFRERSTYGPSNTVAWVAGGIAREGFVEEALELARSFPPLTWNSGSSGDERRFNAFYWLV